MMKTNNYISSLKFGLYVITHPLDGFWDLNREKRGSLAAANTFIIMVLATNFMKLQFTNFLFLRVEWEKVNIFIEIAKVILPILLAVIANWGLTTLFDGKGKMKDIYMAIAYSFVPYIIIQIPMIIMSNIFTRDEGAFYFYLNSFSILWVAFLIISATMMIHDFSLTKALIALVATALGMVIILFIVMLFFSLTSDAISYFVSLYKEISFRFY